MDARQQRGLTIAAMFKIVRRGETWQVPSQTVSDRKYTVDHKAQTCTCPDHQEARHKCKHLFAVEFVIQREFWPDGTVTETRTMTVTQRKTYPQDWSAYNAAQTTEKDRFTALLADLCRKIEEPEQKMGRPRLPLADAVFAAVFKVYSTVSGRRFTCDMKEALERGHVTKAPHYNSIFRTMESEALTPILRAMIVESSLPLKAVEEDFAIDSTGFSASKFERWFDAKYGELKMRHEWVKVHVCIGVKTNIITAAEIKPGHDEKQLPDLVKTTAANFTIKEVSADKGYSSHFAHEVVAEYGGTPFIAFKRDARGGGRGDVWAKMFGYFTYRRDEFMAHYHKRSNVESTFSSIKRKFGDNVRSKTPVAMNNEAYAKLLCHNIVTLIHEIEALGIEVNFGGEEAAPNVLKMPQKSLA